MRTRHMGRSTTWLGGVAVLCLAACGGTPTIDGAAGGAGGTDVDAGTAGSGGATGGSSTGTGGVGIVSEGGMPGDGANAYDSSDGCGQSSIQATVKVIDIVLVIDKSGSMTATPTGFATDKWTAMKTALTGALDQVKGG